MADRSPRPSACPPTRHPDVIHAGRAIAKDGTVVPRWMLVPPLATYALSLVVVALAWATRASLDGAWPGVTVFSLFFPAVLLSAVIGGIGPGIVTLATSGLVVTYYWLSPRGSLMFTQDSLVNLGLFGVSAGSIVLVGHLLRISARRSATTAHILKDFAEELEGRVADAVAEREAALQQLHETMKSEMVSQLTGGIAHDFNNLLTPIIGSLDMLSSRPVTPDRSKRLASGALEAAEKARMLVSRLLAFGRRQMLQPRPVDVVALLHGLSDLIQRSIGPGTRLVISLPPSLPAIRVDPNQLELALLNLTVNARDAMQDGGTLTISAQEEPAESDRSLAPTVRISVIDTGKGMDAVTLRRATEPFFTTKGSGRGTGLGLSMVHGLAGQSGGTLLLSSTPGVGTRAELRFPATDDQLSAEAPSAEIAAPSACNLRILLVDDEPLVRTGLADMLHDAGHEVVEVESAREALSLMEDCAAFDFVLTDHLMPGMNGATLAGKLRDSHPLLPVLLVTGYMGADTEVPAEIATLRKPVRQADLLQAIDRAVAGVGRFRRIDDSA